MKKILLICSIFFFGNQLLQSQTTLVPGDIAIVGYNSDEVANEDEFSFVLLRDITAGTSINFTDFGWCSDINGFQSANSCGGSTGALSDGALTWTASSSLPCGTQIYVVCGGTTLSASSGTVMGLQAVFNFPGEYMSLAVGGDQIFAFQGTLSSPTLITGLNMNGDWDVSLLNCAFTSTQSVLPAALNASNSIAITPEVDNARYNCIVTNDSPTNLRTAIFSLSNWNVDNATPYTLPLACTFGCSTLGSQDFENNLNFILYPNPTTGNFIIKTTSDEELNVVNQLGQTVMTIKVFASVDNYINLEHLSKGVYILKGSNNRLNTKRLIIK